MKFKLNKKSLSFVISIIFIFTMVIVPTVQAASSTTQSTYIYNGKTYTINISQNSSGQKTVDVNSTDEHSTVVYNAKTNSANIQSKDKVGRITSNSTVNLGTNSLISTSSICAMATTSSSSIYRKYTSGSESWWKHSYTVYKYTISSKGYWWNIVKNGGSKAPIETPSNTSELNGFKDAVDSAASNEAIVKGMLGAAICGSIAAALSAPGTLGTSAIIALAVAAGGTIAAIGYVIAAYVNQKDADYHYGRIN